MGQDGEIRLERPLRTWERALLGECNLYLVGGIVRDLLLGERYESLDEDYLVTGIDIERLVTVLRPLGKTNLVGRSFGVIKYTSPEGRTVDISLPRTEYSVGPGHRDFHVDFDPMIPVENDLVRRDFTINSMALHLGTGELVDPLGGRGDLAERVLRVNREESFREDPLRILRGVQFYARFGLTVEAKTREMMVRDAELLGTVSMERIREELNKMLLRAERPGAGFILMHETGILGLILPELEDAHGVEQNEYHPDDLFMHSVRSCDAAPPDLVIRWGALLHDLGKKKMRREKDDRVVFYRHEEESARIARAVLERLRFPRDFARRVEHLVRHHMFQMTDEWSDAAVRRFIARIGVDNLDDIFALCEADVRSRAEARSRTGEGPKIDEKLMCHIEAARMRVADVLASEATFKREHLAVNGSDIIELLGIEGGPEVGEILERLLDLVIEQPELNTRERLLEIVADMRGKE